MRLVGDIGGTNARLALCENGLVLPNSMQTFANDDWPHLYDVIARFLKDHDVVPDHMVIAVAGPLAGGQARLTNRNWVIDRGELMLRFGCGGAVLLNDLSALGYGVPTFKPAQLDTLHVGGPCEEPGQSLIVGIGTGFNASPVLQTGDHVQCLAVEAGHMAMPVSVAQMIQSFGCDPGLFPSVEDLFSGRGFEKYCQAQMADASLRGRDVIEQYVRARSSALARTVDSYGVCLGQMLRELTLAYMPNAGIYLAGSVARAVVETAPEPCVDAYASPCRIAGQKRPNLFVIKDDFAALQGCAAFRI